MLRQYLKLYGKAFLYQKRSGDWHVFSVLWTMDYWGITGIFDYYYGMGMVVSHRLLNHNTLTYHSGS